MTAKNARWQVLQWAGRIAKYATLASVAGRFGYGLVDAPPADAEEGEQQTQQPVRFMQWFGFRSTCVVKQGEAIVIAPRGGTSNAVVVAADNLAHGPTDLQEGESAMYSSGGSVIRQDTAGKVTIDAKAPSDVVVNGGSLKVARATDQTSSGSVTFSVIPDPGIPGNFIFQVVAITENGATQTIGISCPGASASTATTANPLIFPIIGQITGPCASRFKA